MSRPHSSIDRKMLDTNRHSRHIANKTSGTKASKAAEKVWHTAELLEKVLLLLPLHDLLLSQQVCRTWHRGTDAILEALFLRPHRGRCTFHSTNNSHAWSHGWGDDWEDLDGKTVYPVYNPFLSDFIFIPDPERNKSVGLRPYEGAILHESLIAPTFTNNTHQELAFLGIGASWRNMLVMQPPATEITFDCYEHWHEVTGETVITVSNPNGVTWGELVDTYRAHWLQCPACPIWDDPEYDGPARWEVQGGLQIRVMSIGTGFDSLRGIKNVGVNVAA